MSASALAIRPGMGRIVAITALGPFFSTALIFAYPMLGRLSWQSAQLLPTVFGYFLISGYSVGLVPSLIAAVAYTYFYPVFTSRLRQVIGCLVIGALVGGGSVLLTSFIAYGLFINPVLVALSAAGGAFALIMTALPFSERP